MFNLFTSNLRTVYFQHPHNGPVYSIRADSTALELGINVRLPEGKCIHVVAKDGWFPVIDDDEVIPGRYPKATIVIDVGTFVRTFDGNWEHFVDVITAAAEANSLFSVKISPEEYERLEAGGFEDLQEMFDPYVAQLLSLQKDYLDEGPSVELWRFVGHCPNC